MDNAATDDERAKVAKRRNLLHDQHSLAAR